MVSKGSIHANLRGLAAKFKTASPKDALYFSKLAILELCGWIEESMDDVVLCCARRRLKENENKKFVEAQVVKRTYAFDYDKFRLMLIRLIGIINVERIERKMDATRFVTFKATLSTLKLARDSEAHTHIKGVAKTINAPSVTINQFAQVYLGLKEFEELLRKAKM